MHQNINIFSLNPFERAKLFQQSNNSFRADTNAKMPEPKMTFDQMLDGSYDDGLHVPESAPPIGANVGMHRNDDIVVAPDGTILSISKRKVISAPKTTSNEWSEYKEINHYNDDDKSWHDNSEAKELAISRAYWDKIHSEQKTAETEMTEEQKQMLKELAAGRWIKRSSLIDA